MDGGLLSLSTIKTLSEHVPGWAYLCMLTKFQCTHLP